MRRGLAIAGLWLAALGSAGAQAATPELLACGTAKASPELTQALADGIARSIEEVESPISEADGQAVAMISAQCGQEHKMSLAAMRPFFEYYVLSIGRKGLRVQLAEHGYDPSRLDAYVAANPDEGTTDDAGLLRAIARARAGHPATRGDADRLPRIYVTAGRLEKRVLASLP